MGTFRCLYCGFDHMTMEDCDMTKEERDERDQQGKNAFLYLADKFEKRAIHKEGLKKALQEYRDATENENEDLNAKLNKADAVIFHIEELAKVTDFT